jgi:hypothetical protein
MTKNKITRNWIAFGVIWIGALVLTHFNSQAVEQIKTNRAALESMRMDSIFLRNNFEKISRVFNRRTALHKSIDSLQIELVALENMLRLRAKERGLSNFQIIGEPISKGIDQVSIKFNATGTYREMALWLQNIENEVPYLVVNQVDMQTDAGPKERAFSLYIDFRYKLTSEDEDAA